MSGYKTYNAAINVLVDGRQVVPGAYTQYEDGFKIECHQCTRHPCNTCLCLCQQCHTKRLSGYRPRSAWSAIRIAPGMNRYRCRCFAGWRLGRKQKTDINRVKISCPETPIYVKKTSTADIKNGGKYVVVQRTADKDGKKHLMAGARRQSIMTTVCLASSAPKAATCPIKPQMANTTRRSTTKKRKNITCPRT